MSDVPSGIGVGLGTLRHWANQHAMQYGYCGCSTCNAMRLHDLHTAETAKLERLQRIEAAARELLRACEDSGFETDVRTDKQHCITVAGAVLRAALATSTPATPSPER